MDLVEWLRKQLDQDERLARYSGGVGRWWVGEDTGNGWTVLDGNRYECAVVHGSTRVQHVARHDPRRVLREVEAKRRILDLHSCGDDGYGPYCRVCADPCQTGEREGEWPCQTVRLLALPHADGPGYRGRMAALI